MFRKGVLITGVTASAARDRSYELTFTAIPYSERYGYRPALIPCPVMAGTLPARVTSTVKNDIYAHIDKDGRYRVNLDFDRDTWKPGYESLTAIPYSERYGYRPALIPRPVMAGTLPARVTSTVKNDIYAHIDKDGRYRVNLDFDRDTWKPGYESLLKGQSTSSLLMPGLEIRVQGDDAPAVFRKGVLITGVTASAARDRSYELTFTAIPYSERYGYRPALIPRPVMAGTLPARVTSTVKNDIYAHIDKDGRYRVNLDFDRDTWKPGYESLWVRQSRPYAGDTYGLHLPLLAGTEVSIAFEEGNPDRPYIAGVKHDSAHTDHVTIQNYKRNVLRTPANNKIRLDDERGKEHIKVSTEYGGKSQLNLGHLVDAGKQQRGEGFELRTDLWGTVRAKKGIFISSDAQDKAQGKVREMAPAMAILDGAQSQMKSLSTDAQTANADPADLSSQIALLQQSVKDLTQAAILLSAPKGVAIASGEHLQLAASKNLIANAGNHADIGVVKNMFIGVGQALSVFVRKAGIKLFANKGAISVQAQNDLMELLAQKSIEITSTEDEIKITAKKKITLNGGGSYIRLDACGIEAGTPGEYNVKAGYYGRKPKAKLTPELMAFPVIKSEDFNQSFILLDENTGQPLINWPYELELESGLKMSGITDENGNTELISSDKEEVVNISVFEPDEFLDDEIN